MGEPTCLFSSRQRLYIKESVKCLGNTAKAARAAGIPRRTVYNWFRNTPGFAEACLYAEEERLDIAEELLFKNMEGGSLRAVIFFLRAKGRDRGYF